MPKLKIFNRDLPLHLILLLFALPTFFPVFVMLSISGKDFFQYGQQPLLPTLPFNFANYEVAWSFMSSTYFNNTLIIGVGVAAILLFASLTAFSLARFSFPGRKVLFYFVLAVLAIPSTVILVPLFMLIVDLGLLNTRWAVILPYAASQSFAILVFYTFFYSLSKELFESAQIDGANFFQMYLHLGLPLARPIMSAIGVFLIWLLWNDYIWPSLVLSDPELQTVALKLVVFYLGRGIPEPGQGMAASVISSIPLVLLFLVSMRTFIAGLTAGAIKG
ncbi:MAG: carbohydrate ABC transporter permease [Anaerolineae bacterium]|nr:carbohydrate ABC transporter permease [Anaerolineae bacterium]NUQ03027.1 carbohydrate ABC transporter permease [Anaerolineae bacterium]